MSDQDTGCTHPAVKWQDLLVAYLYDESEPDERQKVERHLAECPHCAGELDGLQSTRSALAAWSPPQPVGGFRVVGQPGDQPSWWRQMLQPSWGMATAAAVVLVVGAAIASIEIRYDTGGFVFRMGWTPSVEGRLAEETPWRDDLSRLESELRRELTVPVVDPRAAASTQGVPTAPALRDEMRGLIAQSERRQQQELALWFTEFAQEFDMQRRADQQQVQREIGALEGYTDYLVRTTGR